MQVTYSPFTRLKTPHVVGVFDNPSSATNTARALSGWRKTARDMANDRDFYGNTWDGMERAAIAGSADFANRAKALEKKIAGVTLATAKRVIRESPFGRPCVGAYLAGDPMPCRRAVSEKVIHAPLSIVVSVNTHWSVSQDDMEQRGTAIAALVQNIAAQRPVNLYLSRFCNVSNVNSCFLVKFPTAPLDRHRLAYLVSSQAFARGLFFALCRSAKDVYAMAGKGARDVSASDMISPAGGATYSQSRNCPFASDLKDFLRSDLLYIPGAYPGVGDFDKMIRDPVSWINDTVAELTRGAHGKGKGEAKA